MATEIKSPPASAGYDLSTATTTTELSSASDDKKIGGFSLSADAYRAGVERISTLGSQQLVDLVDGLLPLGSPKAAALDDGCGTGITTVWMKQKAAGLRVVATDVSMKMLEEVGQLRARHGWGASVETRQLDATDLRGVPDGAFSHGLCTYVLPFIADGERALAERARVVRPGGVLGLATWGDPSLHVRDAWAAAAAAVVPGYTAPVILVPRFCKAESVQAAIEAAGFRDVQVRHDSAPWKWDSPDHLVDYCLYSGHPGPKSWLTHFEDATGRSRDEVVPHWRKWYADRHGSGPLIIDVQYILFTARR